MRIDEVSRFGAYGSVGARNLYIRGQSRQRYEVATADRFGLERFGAQLRDLRLAVDRLGTLSGGSKLQTVRGGRSAVAAVATSASSLDLLPYATFTTLRSAEVNTTPTSFGPRGPEFGGLSSSLPTVGGVYDGDQGDDVLTFTARDTAVVGSGDKLRIRVRDGEGNTIQNLNFKDVAAGEPITLRNGLTLSLGAGAVVKNDSFTVSVSTSVGASVDPTKPFDGVRNDDPELEPGLSVGPGSFQVNGASIGVLANDSIDSVLAKITASAAGVSASFDAATETVLLTQKTPGSAPSITFGADSSGFLAATKLSGQAPTPGQDGVDPVDEVMASVDALNEISSGEFSVNGVAVSIDIDADTLGDVLDRINASSAGVVATLDPDTLRVTIVPDDPSASLVLDDGTSGLFSALQIAPGLYQSKPGTESVRKPLFEDSEQLRPILGQVRRFIGQLFREAARPGASPELRNARDALRSTLVGAVLGEQSEIAGRPVRTGLGIDFDLANEEGDVVEIDTQRLDRTLTRKPQELYDLLFAEAERDGTQGIQPALAEVIERLQASVSATLSVGDARGRLFDRLA